MFWLLNWKVSTINQLFGRKNWQILEHVGHWAFLFMRLCRNCITWSPLDSILGDGICRSCNSWNSSLLVIGRCNPCRNQIGLNWRVSRSIRLVFCISAVLYQIPLQDQYVISCLNTLHNWNRPLEWSGLPIFQPSYINCTLLHFYMFLAISIPCICPWKKT